MRTFPYTLKGNRAQTFPLAYTARANKLYPSEQKIFQKETRIHVVRRTRGIRLSNTPNLGEKSDLRESNAKEGRLIYFMGKLSRRAIAAARAAMKNANLI